MKRIKRFRIYWSFQHEEEELWLNRMSEQGYHLVKEPAFFIYTFEFDPSVRYTYRLDFADRKMDKAAFDTFYEEMDWETVGNMFNGWYYFRKFFAGDKAESLYSDRFSKAELYRRVRRLLGTFLGVEAMFLAVYGSRAGEGGFLGWLWIPFLLLTVFLGFHVWKLSVKIRNLEEDGIR